MDMAGSSRLLYREADSGTTEARQAVWGVGVTRTDSQCFDLLGLPLALLVAVPQPAVASKAPAPETAVGGEGEAVEISSRDTHSALAAQRRREAGRRVELRHALAVAEEPFKFLFVVLRYPR